MIKFLAVCNQSIFASSLIKILYFIKGKTKIQEFTSIKIYN